MNMRVLQKAAQATLSLHLHATCRQLQRREVCLATLQRLHTSWSLLPLEAWSSIGMPQTTTPGLKKLAQAPKMVDRANKNEQGYFEPALLRHECSLCIQQPRTFSCMQMHALCGSLDCKLTLTAHACPTKHSRGVAACEEAVEAVCGICGPCSLYCLAVIEALAASS